MARENVYPISAAAYDVLYYQLRKVLIEECLKNNPEKSVAFDSPYLWDFQDSSGKPFSLKLFDNTTITDTHYFYRKYLELDPQDAKNGSINRLLLIKAFEYIGLKPSIDRYEKLNPEKKIIYLANAFHEKYATDIAEVESSANNSNNNNQSSDKIKVSRRIQNCELGEAIFTVNSFYKNISAGNHKIAWDLLSPKKQLQNPWKGEFKKFQIGYLNTINLRNIVVLHTNQPEPETVEFKIFYDDEINAYTSPELHQFEILKVKDIDSFAQLVKNLLEDFKSKGLSGFENIELKKLFDPDASEYIWYKAKFPAENLDEIFPIQKSVTVRRVQECICRYYSDSWFVDEIKSIKSYSIR